MACKAIGENRLIEHREMAVKRERKRMANLLDSWIEDKNIKKSKKAFCYAE